jgi:hypothetical protein
MELRYTFKVGLSPVKVTTFQLRLGDDCPHRDPLSWKLEGNLAEIDDPEDWEELVSFEDSNDIYIGSRRKSSFLYGVNKIATYSGFRFSAQSRVYSQGDILPQSCGGADDNPGYIQLIAANVNGCFFV